MDKNEILFYSLGGLGEVGKNCYCIEYKNEIIVIDAGALFPDTNTRGIDLIIPNFSKLLDPNKKIAGLFITHAHEDHIGGVPYFIKELGNIKIYANGVSEALIKRKCQEHGQTPNIVKFTESSKIKISNGLEVSFFSVVHSIPDAFGIIIKTPFGNIVHTGDFKFDFTPIGVKTNFKKIAKAANEGVLCLLSDSTNSLLNDFTSSEKQVGNSIKDLFMDAKKRVIVSTFASNMHRVQQIVEGSIKTKRKIAVFGRSMESNIKVGEELSYIKAPKGTFISASEMNQYKPEEITILCTGSQGEELAALSRIANGIHKDITIYPGDTVIFSSSPIPGNQSKVDKTINNLFKSGANVIVNSPLFDTHTSGHAGRLEQLLMLNLTKPKYFIPIHGEYHMLKTHGDTGIDFGLPEENVFVLERNGQAVSFTEEGAKLSHSFPCDPMFIDGKTTFSVDNQILKQRKIMSEHGVICVIISINKKELYMSSKTLIVSRGFIYMKSNEDIINKIKKIADSNVSKMLKTKQLNEDKLKLDISEQISEYVYRTTERKPIIEIRVMYT